MLLGRQAITNLDSILKNRVDFFKQINVEGKRNSLELGQWMLVLAPSLTSPVILTK